MAVAMKRKNGLDGGSGDAALSNERRIHEPRSRLQGTRDRVRPGEGHRGGNGADVDEFPDDDGREANRGKHERGRGREGKASSSSQPSASDAMSSRGGNFDERRRSRSRERRRRSKRGRRGQDGSEGYSASAAS